MLCLSLWLPCAVAFFYPPEELQKGLENRDWPPPKTLIGQRIALHSGRKIDEELDAFCSQVLGIANRLDPAGRARTKPPYWEHWYDEGIIGTVKVIGWMAGESWDEAVKWNSIYGGNEARAWVAAHPEQKRWFIRRFAWICTERRVLKTPIHCAGHQKLWTVPPEIELEILKRR